MAFFWAVGDWAQWKDSEIQPRDGGPARYANRSPNGISHDSNLSGTSPGVDEFARERVADESFLRLVGKGLHVGVLDDHEDSDPSEGTVQGSILSPLLGNIYLHYALDRWFELEIKPILARGGLCAENGICGGNGWI